MRVPVALLGTTIALAMSTSCAPTATSATSPAPAPRAMNNVERYLSLNYPLAGIDEKSYLYWPVTPPDMEPLRLVRAGDHEGAFNYCFKKMQETGGNLQLFYAVQASTAGYQVHKVDQVVDYISNQIYADPERRFLNEREFVSDELMLAQLFASRVHGYANQWDPDPERRKIHYFGPNSHDHLHSDLVERFFSRTFDQVEKLCVAAEILQDLTPPSNLPPPRGVQHYDPTAYQRAWKLALDKNPKSPGLNLAASQAFLILPEIQNDKLIRQSERYAEEALRLEPSNSRAALVVARNIRRSDPQRAKKLFRQIILDPNVLETERSSAKKSLQSLENPSQTPKAKTAVPPV